jgi:ABC-2 type transport system permease protein
MVTTIATRNGRLIPRARRWLLPWRAALVTPRAELTQTSRLLPPLTMMTSQLLLTTWLWHALYAHTRVSAGLDVRQATSYALFGVLYVQVRMVDRWSNGDSMVQLMTEGTIAYWFLRPVSPRRYYLIRAVGDLVYGGALAALGYVACLAAGVISLPASPAAGLAAAITLVFGMVITYYIQLLVDLMCFWSTVNDAAVTAVSFATGLLSGAFAPLWFFPSWFQRVSDFLPFQSTLNTPLSLYVGRLPVTALPGQVAVQAAWCAALAALSWLLWRRAAARVTVLGG